MECVTQMADHLQLMCTTAEAQKLCFGGRGAKKHPMRAHVLEHHSTASLLDASITKDDARFLLRLYKLLPPLPRSIEGGRHLESSTQAW